MPLESSNYPNSVSIQSDLSSVCANVDTSEEPLMSDATPVKPSFRDQVLKNTSMIHDSTPGVVVVAGSSPEQSRTQPPPQAASTVPSLDISTEAQAEFSGVSAERQRKPRQIIDTQHQDPAVINLPTTITSPGKTPYLQRALRGRQGPAAASSGVAAPSTPQEKPVPSPTVAPTESPKVQASDVSPTSGRQFLSVSEGHYRGGAAAVQKEATTKGSTTASKKAGAATKHATGPSASPSADSNKGGDGSQAMMDYLTRSTSREHSDRWCDDDEDFLSKNSLSTEASLSSQYQPYSPHAAVPTPPAGKSTANGAQKTANQPQPSVKKFSSGGGWRDVPTRDDAGDRFAFGLHCEGREGGVFGSSANDQEGEQGAAFNSCNKSRGMSSRNTRFGVLVGARGPKHFSKRH